MSDTTYNVFQHYGTNAERLAFVPNPAAAIKPLYIWYETDTDNVYIFTTAWKGPISGTGVVGIHAPTHQLGGIDPIKLDDLNAPDDNTDLNSSITAHGLLPKLTGSPTQFLDGTGAFVALPAPAPLRRQVTVVIDGGSVVITPGLKAYLSLPVAGTWMKWRILADISGSIVLDIWKDVYANYPPLVADTITAGAKPTLTTALSAESSTLTGWTTAFAAGDVIAINVDSASLVKKISFSLEFE